MKYTFDIPKVKHEYPLTDSEKAAYKITPLPLPSKWINEKMVLPSSGEYAEQGKITLEPWQVWLVNAIANTNLHELALCACTQLGKSFVFEMICSYLIKHRGGSYLFVYSELDTVKDVFSDRLKPLFEENPELKGLLTGVEDDLTQEKIKLKNGILRIGSSGLRRSMASHSYQVVYGSEVSKWQKKNFDPIKLCKGRYTRHIKSGRYLLLLESSPFEDGDLFDIECKRISTHVFPHVKCPHCKGWFFLEDRLIKEIANSDGINDHNPERIEKEKAAYLECPHCKGIITEDSHYDLLKEVIWADKPESIVNDTQPDYSDKTEICAHINKLYSIGYSFSICLSNYFSALFSSDPDALATYNQEDMGRSAVRTGGGRLSENLITSKRAGYFQFGDSTAFDNEIELAIVGMDTMDDYFRYVIRGFDPDTASSWLIREDQIQYSDKMDPFKIAELIKERVFAPKNKRFDGSEIPIIWGFIDRGGHRSTIVDKVCKYILLLHPVIGGTKRDIPLIRKSDKEEFYICNTEQLARLVEKMSQTDNWFLPDDISTTYITEFLGHYWQQRTLRNGAKKTEFVKLYEDHARSCENYIQAAVQLLDIWTNPDRARRLAARVMTPRPAIEKEKQSENRYNPWLSRLNRG